MIRPITAEDVRAYVQNNQHAYPTFYNGSPEELDTFTEKYTTLFKDEPTLHPVGYFEGNTLLGNMMLIEFEMNYCGKIVKIGGVGAVSVNPLYKKQKVAKSLIQYAIEWSESLHHLFHILYPFNTEFYHNFNFGYTIPRQLYVFSPENLEVPPQPIKGSLRFITPDDLDAVASFIKSHAMKREAHVYPSVLDLRRITKAKHLTGLLYEENNTLLGVVTYETHGTDKDQLLAQKITLNHLLYDTSDALNAFMYHFKKQSDQVCSIAYSTLDPHFHFLLKNIAYGDGVKMRQPINHKCCEQGLGLMTRVVDFKSAVEMATDTAFTLEVISPKEKTTTHLIHGGGDTLTIQHADLSSLLFGAISLESLKSLGRVSSMAPNICFKTQPVICHAQF